MLIDGSLSWSGLTGNRQVRPWLRFSLGGSLVRFLARETRVPVEAPLARFRAERLFQGDHPANLHRLAPRPAPSCADRRSPHLRDREPRHAQRPTAGLHHSRRRQGEPGAHQGDQ
jgi:hypothetical protein